MLRLSHRGAFQSIRPYHHQTARVGRVQKDAFRNRQKHRAEVHTEDYR